MDWVYYLTLIVVLFAGLFVNILGLPGLWLMVLGHVCFAWVTGWDHYVGWSSTIALFVLALLAEGVEFVAGAAGSKAAGGSKRGMIGAVVGGLAGGLLGTPLIPIPVVGTILGAVLGAGLGAFVVEVMIGKEMGHSTRIGWGAAKGRFLGIVAKSCFGIAILFVSVIAAWPTGGASPTTTPILTTTPTTAPATSLSTTAPATLPATAPSAER